MEKATGIGGVFIYSDKPGELAKWYEKHLGIKTVMSEEEGDARNYQFMWDGEEGSFSRSTVWSIFSSKEKPTTTGDTFMINYHIGDLSTMLEQLAFAGITIEKVEEYDYGKFAWIRDPDGNHIELFQAL